VKKNRIFCLQSGYVFTQAALVLIESKPTAERPEQNESKTMKNTTPMSDMRRRAEQAIAGGDPGTVEELTEQFLDVAEDIAADEKAAPNPLAEGCSPERQEALTVRELRALLFEVADQDRTVTFNGAAVTQVDGGRTFTNSVELS